MQPPIDVLLGIIPFSKVIPLEHVGSNDSLSNLGDVAVSDPNVVDLGTVLQLLATLDDDFSNVRSVGRNLWQSVPVARVNQVNGVMNSAFRMNLHIYLDGLGIIRPDVSATRLEPSSFNLLSAFLERDPIAHVFALAVLENWGLDGLPGTEWWGVHDDDGRLQSVAFGGDWTQEGGFGLVVPMGDPRFADSLGAALAARGGGAWMVGECDVVDAIWSSMNGPPPRLSSRQHLMEARSVTAGQTLDIRQAVQGDVDWVHTAARQMLIDDLGIDPSVDAPLKFIRSVEAAIASGSEYVAVHDGVLVYRAKVGPKGHHGAQIGGIWVPPAARNRGVAQAGTRALLNQLLDEHPRVTLHVRESNGSAVRCYLGVGFQHVRDFRLLVR